jgi:hypothetical protein
MSYGPSERVSFSYTAKCLGGGYVVFWHYPDAPGLVGEGL